ncbi:hypothetical protein CALVIDRAFT_532944 [Calocera viscosa TUFC12733]|uniref:AN1-type domain-containing protein n=1 Tax=Calocera viscosa (strain TUFC12733) TaxID=1330018 RepID=A0A167RVK1_CALVF|nr:hypothetical protein CALVIDRAFT_532944 [Calocera viscosa TUFC12733]
MAQPPSNEELLFVGSTCHLDSCKLNDFLPLKCSHCSHTFCSSHFLPDSHHCDKWDPSAHNRVAPNCPFCNVPVAYPSGGDPNLAMEKHFESSCEALGRGGPSRKGTRICAQARCNKALIVPIVCQSCNRQFCPEHRFPASHTCTSAPSPSATRAAPKTSTTKPANAARNGPMALKTTIANQLPSPGERQSLRSVPRPVTASSATGNAGNGGQSRTPFSKADRCEPSSAPSPAVTPTPAPASARSLLFAVSFAPPPLFANTVSPTVSVRA